MYLRWLLPVLALSLLAFTGLPVQAATQTITAMHTYVMGDRDNKEDARALCYMTAKRKVLEEAGVLIESASEVKNFDLTKDQINSYSAAILSVKVVKEEFAMNNGTTSLTLTVSADVDMEDVRKRLADIAANKGLQAKMDAQQQQIRKMEQQVRALTEKLSGASNGSKEEVRNDRDIELAAYYRLGAERGEANSQVHLGAMYSEGKGVLQDKAQAVAWYRKAAEQGDALGQFFLGAQYGVDKGVLQDDAQAVAWVRKAAEQGLALAQEALGDSYLAGKGVPQDDTQAAAWFRTAAEQGHARAQGKLGVMYYKGQGIPQDYQAALKWYRKAAEQGDAVAQYNLGLMYRHGQGIPQDDAQAVEWFRKAAEQGLAQAQVQLGGMYFYGRGVPQDFVHAYMWNNIAAAGGNKDGSKMRDIESYFMTPAQRAEAQRLSSEWEQAFERRREKK